MKVGKVTFVRNVGHLLGGQPGDAASSGCMSWGHPLLGLQADPDQCAVPCKFLGYLEQRWDRVMGERVAHLPLGP